MSCRLAVLLVLLATAVARAQTTPACGQAPLLQCKDGVVITSADISPPQITADQDDYNPTGLATASVIRLSTDATVRTITGLAGGSDGRRITLVNTNASIPSIMLSIENIASTASNRFAGGADIELGPGWAVDALYDATSSRWRLLTEDATSLQNPNLVWAINAAGTAHRWRAMTAGYGVVVTATGSPFVISSPLLASFAHANLGGL